VALKDDSATLDDETARGPAQLSQSNGR
jgi:hypothetical protein